MIAVAITGYFIFILIPLRGPARPPVPGNKKSAPKADIKYRVARSGCLVNAFSLYRIRFSPFHKIPSFTLYKTTSWNRHSPVLYYRQGKGESHVLNTPLSKSNESCCKPMNIRSRRSSSIQVFSLTRNDWIDKCFVVDSDLNELTSIPQKER